MVQSHSIVGQLSYSMYIVYNIYALINKIQINILMPEYHQAGKGLFTAQAATILIVCHVCLDLKCSFRSKSSILFVAIAVRAAIFFFNLGIIPCNLTTKQIRKKL